MKSKMYSVLMASAESRYLCLSIKLHADGCDKPHSTCNFICSISICEHHNVQSYGILVDKEFAHFTGIKYHVIRNESIKQDCSYQLFPHK